MEVNINAYHLRRSEVEYELRIRKQVYEGTAGDLRKRLTQCLNNRVEPDESVVGLLDSTVELEHCATKFQDLSALVKVYQGDFQDNGFHRIVSRLWHLLQRVQRIPEVATSTVEGEEVTQPGLVSMVQKLIESFKRPETPGSETLAFVGSQVVEQAAANISESVENVGLPNLSHCKEMQATVNQPEVRTISRESPQLHVKQVSSNAANAVSGYQLSTFKPKYVPVYKWGLKFDNTGPSIAAFLERVEELRRARGVTQEELFDSAVDLFSGAALVWYRASANRITSWSQLASELKEVFQPPDYDFRLHQEIFNRIQGEQEPIDLYIAAMEGLYGRLSVPILEPNRLAQIYHNLHPQLQDRLALMDIKTLDDLRLMGRRAEAGRLRSSRPRPSPRSDTILEPDLSYQDCRRRVFPSGKVASLQVGNSSDRRRELLCWNCGGAEHCFRDCTKQRKRFCYGCGAEGIIRRNCTVCCPKNF